MQSIRRSLAVTGLVAGLVLAACGGAASTAAPGTQGPGATPGGGTPGSGGGSALTPETLPAALLAPVFGGAVPEPQCGDMAPSGDFCRWSSADGSIVLDVQRDGQFGTEEAWRAAFGTAGFDEELHDLSIPVLGRETVLSPGYEAAAYGPDKTSYSVSLTSDGDTAAVKAMVLAVLRAFSGG